MNQKPPSDVDALVSSFLVELSTLSVEGGVASKIEAQDEVQNNLPANLIAEEPVTPEFDVRQEELFAIESTVESEELNQELARALDELEGEHSKVTPITTRQNTRSGAARRSSADIEILSDFVQDKIHLRPGILDAGLSKSLSFEETEPDRQEMTPDPISRLRELIGNRPRLIIAAAIVLVVLMGLILIPLIFESNTGETSKTAAPSATPADNPSDVGRSAKQRTANAAAPRKKDARASGTKAAARKTTPNRGISEGQAIPGNAQEGQATPGSQKGQTPAQVNPAPGPQAATSNKSAQPASDTAKPMDGNRKAEAVRSDEQVAARESAQLSPVAAAAPGVIPAPRNDTSGAPAVPQANTPLKSKTIPSPPPSSLEGVSPASSSDRPAVAIKKVVPIYPSAAQGFRNSTKVALDVDVDENGNVIRASALNGPEVFRRPAEEALMHWLFTPATRGGVKIKSTVRVAVDFKP